MPKNDVMMHCATLSVRAIRALALTGLLLGLGITPGLPSAQADEHLVQGSSETKTEAEIADHNWEIEFEAESELGPDAAGYALLASEWKFELQNEDAEAEAEGEIVIIRPTRLDAVLSGVEDLLSTLRGDLDEAEGIPEQVKLQALDTAAAGFINTVLFSLSPAESAEVLNAITLCGDDGSTGCGNGVCEEGEFTSCPPDCEEF